MALNFSFVRTKTGGPDADPNGAAPGVSDVWKIPQRRHSFGGRDPVKGYIYYLVFKNGGGAEVANGKADVTPWVKDENLPNSWAASAPDKNVKHRNSFTNLQTWVNDADVFFQLTNITGTGVASVEVHAEAL